VNSSSSEEAEEEANEVVENSVCPFPVFMCTQYLYPHSILTIITWTAFDNFLYSSNAPRNRRIVSRKLDGKGRLLEVEAGLEALQLRKGAGKQILLPSRAW
jgi:hypothetical protein